MDNNSIDGALKEKFLAWADSIKDERVKELILKHTIISGGAIVSYMQDNTPNDFDLYFANRETVWAVANYYANIYNGRTADDLKVEVLDDPDRVKLFIASEGVIKESKEDKIKYRTEKYRPVFFSSNAITLSDDIQLVIRFAGQPEEIHKNYDFEHTKAYWTSESSKTVIPQTVKECVEGKTLKYSGSLYPVCSIMRVRKFLKRGWKISAGQLFKMSYQVSKLDLTDIEVLKDQLVGVDSAYFTKFIQQMEKDKGANPDLVIDNEYVMDLIDRIF